MDFSNYLKQKREDKKLSIRQLAKYSGVSPAYISQVEKGQRGTPTPDYLKKLAKGLKTPYEELMKAAGYIENPQEVPFAPLSLREKIIKLSEEHPSMDLMFSGLDQMDNETLERAIDRIIEMIEFENYKKSKK